MRKFSVTLILCFLGISSLAAQSITITVPARGSNWCRGQRYVIAWTGTGNVGAMVNIRLQQEGTGAWFDIADTANGGSYPWTVPLSLAAGRYTVVIRNRSRTIITTSQPFTIADCGAPLPPMPAIGMAGIIEVLSPAAGSVFAPGGGCPINWKSKGVEGQLLNIQLYTKDKILVKKIADDIPNNGSLPWAIPENIKAGDYFVNVETVNHATAAASGLFSIRSPGVPVMVPLAVIVIFSSHGPLGLTLTNPAQCELLKMGTWYSIGWRANCPSAARLRVLLVQNDRIVMTLAESVPACDQHFDWMVGRAAGGASRNLVGVDYRFVLQTPDGSDMGVSAQPFPIVDWTLAVQAPNGGETWAYGTPQTISWRTSGSAMVANPAYPYMNHVRIDLFRPTGAFVGTIACDAPDVGSYRWTVGVALDNSGRRVRLADGPYVVTIFFGCRGGIIDDQSNAPFTISGCPR